MTDVTTAPADEPEVEAEESERETPVLAAPGLRLEHVDRPDPRRADPRLQPARLQLVRQQRQLPQHRHRRRGPARARHRDDLRDHHRGHRPLGRRGPGVQRRRGGQGHERRGRRQLGRHHPRPRRLAGRRHGVGGLQRVPRGQGQDPRRSSSRSARSGMSLGAALRDHGRRRRARGAVQAHHDHRNGARVQRDPVAGRDRLRRRDRVRDHPRRDPLRPLHLRGRLQRGGGPARGHRGRLPSHEGLRASSARSRASPGSCRSRASRPRRSAATTPTTCRRSRPSSSAAPACSEASGRCSAPSSASSSRPSSPNGFIIVGVQAFWQQIAVGAVLIGAVYLDQLRRRSQDRR